MSTPTVHPTGRPTTRNREDVPEQYRWDLSSIYPTWEAWQADYQMLAAKIESYPELKGTLAGGADALLRALKLNDELDALAYKVWYYPGLRYDEDQRDNDVNAKRQQVQILLARWQEVASWFNPELLAIPAETIQAWLRGSENLAGYRFLLENLYRQQEHVLDAAGERLMSLTARLAEAPSDTYAALSTADVRYPTITLCDGEDVTVSYAAYREILATRRNQADREKAFRALYGLFEANLNTYAALYNGVLQRGRFAGQARGYRTTLEATLHGNNIPPSVVENLIASTLASVAPLRRYHRLRKRTLGLETYHAYDFSIPLVEQDTKYAYADVLESAVECVEALGESYQRRVREAFDNRWIDVYENEGKRSGAYSAPVYGAHPYMLLNYNDTLDAAFTLVHEMGHSMHTILAHEAQPILYAAYTIFVAEVPSTLTEALFLEHMLARTTDPRERIVLLQHAIDSITGTFYSQVLFADYELRAHRLVEQGQAVTAAILSDVYAETIDQYYGDALDPDEHLRITWARIPHFYGSPYYVYQYATCFASAAKLGAEIMSGAPAERAAAVERYLNLLRAGGNDYPMELLKRAGIDLSQPETVQAVSVELERLVSRLESELEQLGGEARTS